MTKNLFKQKYLVDKIHEVNKDNCIRLQTILQEFDILPVNGDYLINWHSGLYFIQTFKRDGNHGYDYYQFTCYMLRTPVNYQEMLSEYEIIRLNEYLKDI